MHGATIKIIFNIYFVLAVADYNYCFTYIDVDCNVIVSDGGVFQNCSLYTSLENGLLPEGYRLVGDDAFPLKTYLTKPYNSVPLTQEERFSTIASIEQDVLLNKHLVFWLADSVSLRRK